jgi:UPF0716 protein FxsA
MKMWLFVAFLSVPLIEIALFVQVGGAIGLFPTLAIVILTAILGTYLVRTQGFAALSNLRQSFSQLSDPTEHLAHGAMILFAGALLLTPGFFTDAVGFALMTPPVRQAIINYAKTRVTVQGFQATGDGNSMHFRSHTHGQRGQDDVIDGDFVEMDADSGKKPTHPPSGWTKH